MKRLELPKLKYTQLSEVTKLSKLKELTTIPSQWKLGMRRDAVERVQRSNLFELCRAWASSAKPIRSCHAGCKNRKIKKMEELFELTVNNYKQPTTLPLRTQGALKEHQRSRGGENNLHKIDVVEVGWSMSTRSIDRCRRRRFRGYGGTLLKHTQESNGRK